MTNDTTDLIEKMLALHELASHSPFGLNLTADTALVCPAKVNFKA